MSPKPQGKQSGKNKKPVKVKFPATVYWLKNRYCRMDHTEFTLLAQFSKPCPALQRQQIFAFSKQDIGRRPAPARDVMDEKIRHKRS